MPGVQDHEMVQAFSSDRADQAFSVGIPISQEIPRRILIGEGLDDLLRRPSRRGMLGHIEVQHLATTVFQHDEDEQHLHRDRGHAEEVHRDHLAEVIVQERLPGLAGRPRQFPEDP
jgi:hypothetical protein